MVLDNLSTHAGPEVRDWSATNPNVTFHRITRQSIRRATFTSVNVQINRIRDCVTHWNSAAEPFTWTATTDEILAKVRWVQTSVKQLVGNNAK